MPDKEAMNLGSTFTLRYVVGGSDTQDPRCSSRSVRRRVRVRLSRDTDNRVTGEKPTWETENDVTHEYDPAGRRIRLGG